MEITKVYSAVFSPTGGTKKVADQMAGAFGKSVEEIDLTENRNWGVYGLEFIQHELVIVSVPSYGGRVPGTAAERLARLRGHKTPVLLVTVFGNRAFDDTLLELKDLMEGNGFRVIAAVGAVAEHSIMHEYGAGRPDGADLKELSSFVAQVKEKLTAMTDNGSGESLQLPGNHPFRQFGGVPLKPEAGKDCTRCGTCARLCPVGAIPADRPTETDKDKCISCMRCIGVCPQKARSLNKLLLWGVTKKLAKECGGRKGNTLYI